MSRPHPEESGAGTYCSPAEPGLARPGASACSGRSFGSSSAIPVPWGGLLPPPPPPWHGCS